jgi:hypothetical protein
MTPKGERIMSDAGKTNRLGIARARAGYSSAATSCSK